MQTLGTAFANAWRKSSLTRVMNNVQGNVFVKPNEQCRACSDIVMARKHTFRGAKKKVNSMPKWGDARCFRAGNVRMKAQ